MLFINRYLVCVIVVQAVEAFRRQREGLWSASRRDDEFEMQDDYLEDELPNDHELSDVDGGKDSELSDLDMSTSAVSRALGKAGSKEIPEKEFSERMQAALDVVCPVVPSGPQVSQESVRNDMLRRSSRKQVQLLDMEVHASQYLFGSDTEESSEGDSSADEDSFSDAPYSDDDGSGAVAGNISQDDDGFGSGESDCSSQSDARESDGDVVSGKSDSELSEDSDQG